MTGIGRKAAHRKSTAEVPRLPAYASDLRPIRGRCLKPRCGSRWGIARVSIDLRADRSDTLATLECMKCGRVWRRIKPPPLASEHGYQAVRITLILPASAKRWYSRGRWHREGEDAIVIREATLPEASDAVREYRGRCDRHAATRSRAKVKREAEEAEASARTAEMIERLAAADAEREAEERAAEARDA